MVKMLQSAGQPDPGLLLTVRCGGKFFLDSFGYKGAQGDTALGRGRFGPTEDRVRDFKRSLHD